MSSARVSTARSAALRANAPRSSAPRARFAYALLACVFVLVAACRALPTRAFERLELSFGLSRPDGGVVSAAEWSAFESEVLVAELGGFTLLDAQGVWFDPDAHTPIREGSRVVVHYFDADAYELVRAKALRVADEYKRRFDQQAVLIGWTRGAHELR